MKPNPAEPAGSGLVRLPAIGTLAGRDRLSGTPCLATGGHLKVAVAAWTGTHAFLTRPIGNMDNALDRAAFGSSISMLKKDHSFQPALLACDLHPDYYTTHWAEHQETPIVRVQHHHAHAVACMVEHSLLGREVTAVTWDGTGYGPDDTVWGGEILRVNVKRFRRVSSLRAFPLPGAEAAIRHPNRIAWGMLVQSYGAEQLLREKRLRDRLGLSMNECNVLCGMIHRRVNSPLTSSVGRLFDAVAALVLGVHRVGFEGEAAIQLQAAADRKVYNAYDLGIVHEASPEIGSRADWAPMLMTIVNDCFDGVESGVIAARFHNALANWAGAVAASQALYDVVVSGGCFLNELLTDRVVEAVRASGRRAYTHSVIPAGDGGIAAGQLAIALCA